MFEELNYHPFKPQLIHGLHDEDFDKRVEFCEIFLDMVENDETILDRVYSGLFPVGSSERSGVCKQATDYS